LNAAFFIVHPIQPQIVALPGILAFSSITAGIAHGRAEDDGAGEFRFGHLLFNCLSDIGSHFPHGFFDVGGRFPDVCGGLFNRLLNLGGLIRRRTCGQHHANDQY
jgi:hypothetical protein